MHYPSLTFTLPPSVPKFGPRVGQVVLIREGGAGACNPDTVRITMDTPNILVGTSRGIVPHLSRDHTNGSDAIQWINVPFESFLEQVPPIPTLQNGPHPLHQFLGFDTDQHVTSLCLRDPIDTQEMPPNGNTYVSANCVRGVKKVTLSDWRKYVYKMQPDAVFALTDTPFTSPPFSQKRITKSIERSVAWVADILRPLPGDDAGSFASEQSLSRHPLNVFVHMAGGTSFPAREAFAYALRETLHGPEADAVAPLRCLDEGISGYVFDLAVLRGIQPAPNSSQHRTLPDGFLQLENPDMLQHPEHIVEVLTPTMGGVSLTVSDVLSVPASRGPAPYIASLFKTSLAELPEQKPRLVTGVRSPHEMLRLVRDVGVDLFDVGWAIHAANLGVALDFVFPAPTRDGVDAQPQQRLGHNLYDPVYTHQFGRLADALVGAGECVDGATAQGLVCPCIACSPRSPTSHILHSVVDQQSYAASGCGEGGVWYERPYSRAYIHHLLQTHEMSAHTLLVAHNLAVVSALLADVRRVLVESGNAGFALEVDRFTRVYDESGELFIAAKKDWSRVDRERGKGRLSREREKQETDQGW